MRAIKKVSTWRKITAIVSDVLACPESESNRSPSKEGLTYLGVDNEGYRARRWKKNERAEDTRKAIRWFLTVFKVDLLAEDPNPGYVRQTDKLANSDGIFREDIGARGAATPQLRNKDFWFIFESERFIMGFKAGKRGSTKNVTGPRRNLDICEIISHSCRFGISMPNLQSGRE